MKKDEENIKLSFNDIQYLISLCINQKESGCFWGSKKYFDKRQDRIIKLLKEKTKIIQRGINKQQQKRKEMKIKLSDFIKTIVCLIMPCLIIALFLRWVITRDEHYIYCMIGGMLITIFLGVGCLFAMTLEDGR